MDSDTQTHLVSILVDEFNCPVVQDLKNASGYMSRIHERWCEVQPEYRAFLSQKLRDYVAYLQRKGYVKRPPAPVRPAAVREPVVPTREVALITPGAFDDRHCLHKARRPKPQDLARMDQKLVETLSGQPDIWRINCAVYDAARVLAQRSQPITSGADKRAERRTQKLEAKIREARQYASRIQCVLEYKKAGRPFTPKVRRIAADLRRFHHTLNGAMLQTIKQHCNERIRALVTTKKSLVRRAKGQKQNKDFAESPSRLFQPPQRVVENTPTPEAVHLFWKGIYEQVRPFNADTAALAQFETCLNEKFQNPNNLCPPITLEEVQGALTGARNFSAPGPDGINTYWWKKFPSTHPHLVRIFNAWMHGEQGIPQWFVECRTVLLPTNGDLSDPKNYRPITCLNACYKIFTRVLYMRILKAVDPVFREVCEQRGSKRGVAGCRENLLIDRTITQDSRQYKRNLSMAWIDYRKAFDTTSHHLVVHLLKSLAVPDPIVECLERMILLWRTRFTITSGATKVRTEWVTFRRGVFQGDSLSPLLFCISLLPLSIALRKTKGYTCGPPSHRRHKVTHLFNMDDLKLYASGERELQQSLRVVQEYTHAIGMEFGTDKCVLVHIKRGRCGEYGEDEQLADGSILKHLNAGETYTYLGIEQRVITQNNPFHGYISHIIGEAVDS
ncbi:uncharacterized protein LOC123009112 [Tribolium madens]|uniref:uncharacterized protein LOC123009112 n=1 Tax=Tribolium madens TaxID=41895 RepID=UPI001CF73709|nr:uncharacterized protein LOC123009112 [Tribolium madens]